MSAVADRVSFDETSFTVHLADGGALQVPLDCFSKLLGASPEQLCDVRISASGERLRWEQLDEDISVSELLHYTERRHRAEVLSSQVPADFPWDPTPALLSGTQPKLAVRVIDDKFVAGLTAEERAERWTVCEDLAHQLVPKTLKDAARNPEHSHDESLRRVRRAIEGKGWTERPETDWLMERLRTLLTW